MLEVKTLPAGVVLEIEHLKRPDSLETKDPHRHEYFEIFWVIEGEGCHSIDFEEYPLTSGLIYFITPGQVHHVHSLPHTLVAISFNANLIRSDARSQQILEHIFFKNRSSHPSIRIDDEGKGVLDSLLKIAGTELKKNRR